MSIMNAAIIDGKPIVRKTGFNYDVLVKKNMGDCAGCRYGHKGINCGCACDEMRPEGLDGRVKVKLAHAGDVIHDEDLNGWVITETGDFSFELIQISFAGGRK